MTTRDTSAADPGRERARKVIRGLLNGDAPNGVTPEDCGPWRDVVRALYDAFALDGTPRVKQTYQVLARGDQALRQLVAGDPPPAPPRPLVPPLPEAAAAIYEHEAPCAAWLDDYIAYALEVAPGAPRNFHEMLGLTLAAAAVARRLCLPVAGDFIYPNLYALFIGPSTLFTKTTALKVGAQMLAAAGLDHLLLNPKVTPEALAEELSYDTLPRRRMGEESLAFWLRTRAQASQRVILVDEMSGWFTALRREYNAALLEHFLDAYESPSRLSVAQTVGRGQVDVRDVYLSLFGCSTPEAMAQHLGNRGFWGNGFFPRCAILTPQESPKRIFYPETAYTSVPQRPIAEGLRRIFELFPVPVAELVTVEDDEKSGRAKGAPPAQEVVRSNTHRPEAVMLGDGVWQAWAAFSMALRYDLLMDEGAGVSSDLHASYGRFGAMAMKVAMLLATMDAEELPVVIERRHFARAQRIVESWRANLHELLRQAMKTQGEQVATRIEERLRQKGALTVRELMQQLHHEKKEIADALEVMVEQGQVEAAREGRAVKYRLTTAEE
jgi:hypothetical protein